MRLNLGDVPTWVAAIGTVVAIFVALFQINTERKRRHEAEEREQDERHHSHARLISAIPGMVEQPPDVGLGSVGTGGRSAVD